MPDRTATTAAAAVAWLIAPWLTAAWRHGAVDVGEEDLLVVAPVRCCPCWPVRPRIVLLALVLTPVVLASGSALPAEQPPEAVPTTATRRLTGLGPPVAARQCCTAPTSPAPGP